MLVVVNDTNHVSLDRAIYLVSYNFLHILIEIRRTHGF